jgi:hypothetical protein
MTLMTTVMMSPASMRPARTSFDLEKKVYNKKPKTPTRQTTSEKYLTYPYANAMAYNKYIAACALK